MNSLAVMWAGLVQTGRTAAQNVLSDLQSSAAQNLNVVREQAAQDVLAVGTSASTQAAAAIAPPHPIQFWMQQHASALVALAALVILFLIVRRGK